MPILNNWSIFSNEDNPYLAPECKVLYLQGKIFNDETKRFSDGTSIHTSQVKSFDYNRMTAQTLNTTYQLGEISPDYLDYLKKLDLGKNHTARNIKNIIEYYLKNQPKIIIGDLVEILDWDELVKTGKLDGQPNDWYNKDFQKITFADGTEFYEYQQYLSGSQFKIEFIDENGVINWIDGYKITADMVKVIKAELNDNKGNKEVVT